MTIDWESVYPNASPDLIRRLKQGALDRQRELVIQEMYELLLAIYEDGGFTECWRHPLDEMLSKAMKVGFLKR
jgi:hypothetical protein